MSKDNESVEEYTKTEVEYLDKYGEVSGKLLDDEELYEIIIKHNFNDEKIKEEVLSRVAYLKKRGDDYLWGDITHGKKHVVAPTPAPVQDKKREHKKERKPKAKTNKYTKVAEETGYTEKGYDNNDYYYYNQTRGYNNSNYDYYNNDQYNKNWNQGGNNAYKPYQKKGNYNNYYSEKKNYNKKNFKTVISELPSEVPAVVAEITPAVADKVETVKVEAPVLKEVGIKVEEQVKPPVETKNEVVVNKEVKESKEKKEKKEKVAKHSPVKEQPSAPVAAAPQEAPKKPQTQNFILTTENVFHIESNKSAPQTTVEIKAEKVNAPQPQTQPQPQPQIPFAPNPFNFGIPPVYGFPGAPYYTADPNISSQPGLYNQGNPMQYYQMPFFGMPFNEEMMKQMSGSQDKNIYNQQLAYMNMYQQMMYKAMMGVPPVQNVSEDPNMNFFYGKK